MNVQPEIMMLAAMLPFLAIGALLWVTDRRARRRDTGVARQIALTDAIHRELGAVAAPDVRVGGSGEWVVSVRLPLHHERLVGTVTRITQDVFRRLDRQDPPRVRIVLLPQEPRPVRPGMVAGSTRPAGRLSRAA
jgi:hypothetical protein